MEKQLLNLYCIKRLPNLPWLPILDLVFGKRKTNELFQNIDPSLYAGAFNVVESIADADYFLIPHNWSYIKNKKQYIRECVDLADKHKKTLILFAYQDSAESIDIPNAIIFRPSQYKSRLARNEIMMPAFVEDLGSVYGVSLKNKSSKPSVGFVGKAGFESFMHRIRYSIKNIFLLSHPYKSGIYYRKKSMRALLRNREVVSNFIVRSSFSGNLKSIPLDPTVARKEYIDSMISNDLALSLKGDGNYSLRFYEALSLGRIPLFVDTDCVLPFEDKISYDDIIIRVDYKNLSSIADTVSLIYKKWTQEEYLKRQKMAREIFEKYLYMPVFIKNTFNKEFLSKYEPK